MKYDGDAAREMLRGMEDFGYFCREHLGYGDMNAVHRECCEFVMKDRHTNKLILLPRFTFKSCIYNVGYSLWELTKNSDLRVLINSDTATNAEGFLLDIKNHILGKGSKFREVWGAWETGCRDGKWNDSQVLIRQRVKPSKEPTIDTGGIDTGKVGTHYDLIIFDDIVSDMNVTTKAQMDKVYDCYRKSLSLLAPNTGKVMMIGTRWHYNDAYGRIMAENEKRDTFGIFKRGAIEEGRFLFADTGKHALTPDFLMHQRAEQGSYVFSCLYLNEPVDDEVAWFRRCDFKFYGELKKSEAPEVTGLYEGLYITATLDPAGEGEDYSAGTVCGTDIHKKVYILELFHRQNCAPSELVDWVMRMNKKYRLVKVGIEKTFYRGMLEKELKRAVEAVQGVQGFNNFGIESLETRWAKGEGKRIRIEGLQPYHERGDLLFPGERLEMQEGLFSDLAYQMTQATPKHMPEPNDLIDALSWQPFLVQRGGVAKAAGPPKNTPAWLEEKWIKEYNQMQRRMPRNLRRVWEPSLQGGGR